MTNRLSSLQQQQQQRIAQMQAQRLREQQAAAAKAKAQAKPKPAATSFTPTTAPANVGAMNQTQQYNYYKSLIEKVGPFDPSKPQVLGLRVPTRPDGARNGKFDDVIVVLKDGKVHTFQANTEPAGRYTNRRSDLGQLAPNQQITYRAFNNDPKFGDGFEPVGDPLVQRYDGGIGGQLGAARRDGGGSTMLFHTSFSNNDTGSMGCQTMRPEDMRRFNNLLGGQSFTYTLTQAGADGVPAVNGSNAEMYSGALNDAQMKAAFPSATDAQLKAHAPYVNQILKEMKADTPEKAAAILATISVETGDLKWLEELGKPSQHGGYHGRGYIHLTHRDSYARASRDIFGDDRLLQNPDLAARPDVAAKIFTWYCTKENPSAGKSIQAGDIKATSAAINAGDPSKWSITNGKQERLAAYDRALNALKGGFGGGYVANENTPVDTASMYSGDGQSSVSSSYSRPAGEYSSSSQQWYSPNSNMPFGQDPSIDANRTAAPYASQSSGYDLAAMLSQMMWNSNFDWTALSNDEDFAAWMKKQPFGKNWKPGQPIPKEAMAKFAAEKAAGKMKSNPKLDALTSKLKKLDKEVARLTTKMEGLSGKPQEQKAVKAELDAAIKAQQAERTRLQASPEMQALQEEVVNEIQAEYSIKPEQQVAHTTESSTGPNWADIGKELTKKVGYGFQGQRNPGDTFSS
jgi:predicted chitinase